MSKRVDALRRLGGPVCPVCDVVNHTTQVRTMNNDQEEWLRRKGKSHVVRQWLAPMCEPCLIKMNREITDEKATRAEALARQQAYAKKDAVWIARIEKQDYHHACRGHEDDLAAAEELAGDWIGNGLFGARPKE